jgi:hypothetical protein
MGFISGKTIFQLLIIELEQMLRYVKIIDLAIQDNRKSLITHLESILKDMSDEEKADFYELKEDEIIELSNTFPELLYSNFVISWYSFIEHELINICERLNLRISISIKENFRSREGIDRAKIFLREVSNYKIDNNHWEELNKIRKIRNRLVHQKGILRPKPSRCNPSVRIDLAEDEVFYLPIDEELYRYLYKHSLYHIGEWRITFNYDYCAHLVEFGKELLKEIYEDLF